MHFDSRVLVQDCHGWLEQQDERLVREIAFIFSVCDEVLIINPSSQFDLCSKSHIINQNGATSGFEMCFAPT